MRVCWVDPMNRDPHFLNVLSLALAQAGHEVHVWSVARVGFEPPPSVSWTPFAKTARAPFSLKKSPAIARITASYPFLWRRAVRQIAASGARAVLVTSGLLLPRWDARGLGALARAGVAPVVVVHLPYPGFFDDPGGRRVGRYEDFYAPASRLLFMNADTRARFPQRLLAAEDRRGRWLRRPARCAAWPQQRLAAPEDRCATPGLRPARPGVQAPQRLSAPEDRCATIPAPHYGPILETVRADRDLAGRLRDWAGGAPVATFLSNMRSEHGFEDLLASLPGVDARLDDWRFLVVSSAVSRRRAARVEASLEALGLRSRSWCVWRPYPLAGLKAYLAASSVVVAPYREATQSAAVASAIGMGVPMVATAVGGLPEGIRAGVDGELVAPRDPVALAKAVAEVAANSAAYKRRMKARPRPSRSPGATAEAVVEALRLAAGSGRR